MVYFNGSARVKINGMDLSAFEAKLNSKYEITGSEIAPSLYLGANRSTMESFGSRYGTCEIMLPVDIQSSDKSSTTLRVAQLNAACNGLISNVTVSGAGLPKDYSDEPVWIDLGDRFIYRAVCTECGAPEWITDNWCTVNYVFRAMRMLDRRQTNIVSGNPYALNEGTHPKNDCRITINISAANVADLTRNGDCYFRTQITRYLYDAGTYTSSGVHHWRCDVTLHSGDTKAHTLVFDGINKEMLVNGVARGPDKISWVDYPYLMPGFNAPWTYYSRTGEAGSWQTATSKCTNLVEWYPTFI